MVVCEVDEYVFNFVKFCFDGFLYGSKILVEVVFVLEIIKKLVDVGEIFDLVFIDVDKKEYIEYFKIFLDISLLVINGFICVDNILF